MMKLKLVVTTRVLKNVGNYDIPLWKVYDGNEYIIAVLDSEPSWMEVGEYINKFIHMLEGKVSEEIREIYSGFELYNFESLTHFENFQLQTTANVDFPAIDLTNVDVTEEMDGIKTGL